MLDRNENRPSQTRQPVSAFSSVVEAMSLRNSLRHSEREPVCKALLEAETLLETIDASAGINQLLLAGVEGMALGADIHLQFLLGRTGLKRLTAHAANDALAVVGMDLFLHCDFTSFAYAMIG